MNISIKTIKLSFLLAVLIAAGFYSYQSIAGAWKVNRSAVNNLTSGLVIYYSMDAADTNWTNNTVTDRSPGGTNTGTLTNMSTSTSPTSGRVGQGLNLTAAGASIVKIGVDGLPNVNNAFTMSAWIKTTSMLRAFISMGHGSDTANEFMVTSAPRKIRHTVNWGSNLDGTTTLVDNEWYYAAVTYNPNASGAEGDKKRNLYLNGSLENSDNPSAFNVLGTDLNIGKEHYNENYINGSIDEVRIYSRALSQPEIIELYQQGQTKINASQANKLTNGLVGYWTMDGQDTTWANLTSGTMTDKSGSGNNGIFTTMSQSTSPVIGKIGQAMNFNGSSNSIAAGFGSINLNSTDFTECAWIYPKVISGGTRGIMDYMSDLDFDNMYVRLNGTTALLEVADRSDFLLLSSQSAFSINDWYHVCATLDTTAGANNDAVNIYINGSLNASTLSANYNPPLDWGNTLAIGSARNGGQVFNGYIDEARIYNRVLSASEISELYNQGQVKINASQVNKLTSGLTHYYTFDGADMNGDTVLDKVSSGTIDGTLLSCDVGSVKPIRTIGKIGQGLEYTTQDSCLTFASNLVNSTTYSVSMWMKPDADDMGYLFGAGNQNAIRQGVNGKIDYRYKNNGVGSALSHYSDTDNLVVIGAWNHIVVAVDSGNTTFYINGVMDGTDTSAPTMTGSAIGGVGGQSSFFGKIDEVRVYNRALSAGEVRDLYIQGK